jgi:formamidopyrimidine-DNA glycosylase
VHGLARDFAAWFGGQPLRVSSPQGRFAAAAGQLDGTALEHTDAHGKHLFLGFPAHRWVHVHLGLYGKFTVGALPAPDPRGALRLRISGADRYADLRGPTACELIAPAEKAAIHARLGADPLRGDAHPEVAFQRVSRSRAPLGGLLMDQSVLAGVGNVFRAEVLFRQGLSPFRPGRHVHEQDWEPLWADLVGLLRAALRANRIVTTRPEHRGRRRGPAGPEDAYYVYRRAGQPCRVCGTAVRTEVMQGRNLFWCPVCQAA